jgi:hypothetical protein
MAFVTATATRRRRPVRATDHYAELMRRHPASREFDVGFPGGGGGLGELGDVGTGIDFVDSNLAAIRKEVADATLAARITAACSIAAALASVLLLFRTGR